MASATRRRACTRRHVRTGRSSLHIITFRFTPDGNFTRCTTILVHGRMDQGTAIGLAGEAARQQGREPWLTDVNTVPAPRATPALDALCRRHTAFASFVALLTATAGYRPTIRLDLAGRDGLTLAKAYDRTQAAWGDKRRAFVTGEIAQPSAKRGAHGRI